MDHSSHEYDLKKEIERFKFRDHWREVWSFSVDHLRRVKFRFVAALGLSFVAAFLSGAYMISMITFVKFLFAENDQTVVPEKLGQILSVFGASSENLWVALLGFLVGLIVSWFLVELLKGHLTAQTHLFFVKEVRKTLIHKVLRFRMGYFAKHPVHEIGYLINNDVSRMAQAIRMTTVVITNLVEVLILGFVMVKVSPLLFLVLGVVVLCMGGVNTFFDKMLKKVSLELSMRDLFNSLMIYDMVYAIRMLKLGGDYGTYEKQYAEGLDRSEKEALKQADLESGISGTLKLIAFFTVLVICAIAKFGLTHPEVIKLTTGSVVSF